MLLYLCDECEPRTFWVRISREEYGPIYKRIKEAREAKIKEATEATRKESKMEEPVEAKMEVTKEITTKTE